MPKLTDLELLQQDSMIKWYATNGLGANRTVQALKDIGLPKRRTDVLRIYREYAGIPEKEELIKFVRKEYQIGQGMYYEPQITKSGNIPFMRRRYRYNVHFTTFNPSTEETFVSGHWIASDSPLTRGQLEDQAMSAIQGAIQKYNLVLQKFNLAEAQHRLGDEWD